MSPAKVRAATVLQKSALVDRMLAGLEILPLAGLDAFTADPRDAAAAESYLRRALEAVLDLGRHILAKGLGQGTVEYKQIALALRQAGIVNEELGAALLDMAGYRNRLTHFYDEVTTPELWDVCAHRRAEIGQVRDAMLAWLRDHPELVDREL
jgi:uncharacterized protein YutE (UPF0331/DUF86 family)